MVHQKLHFHSFFIALLISVMLAWSQSAIAKVRIFTFHFNRPDFIELQYKTCKKFILDDYELIVINDGNTPEREEAIRLTCDKYGILCIRYEQEWHLSDPLNEQVLKWLFDPSLIHSHIGFWNNTLYGVVNQPSVRHCHAIQYALDNFGYDHNDVVAILDGDIFPIRPISLKILLAKSPLAGIRKYIAEEDLEYLWVPFIAFNPTRLPNVHDLKFHVALIEGFIHDTGAYSYYYMKNNPRVNVKKFDYHGSASYFNESPDLMRKHGFNANEIALVKDLPWPQCVEFHVNHCFLHFAGSSFGLAGHEEKAACVRKFIEKITQN